MVRRNPHFSDLAGSYLFSKVREEVELFRQKNRDAELINLGIGDTSEPLGQTIVEGLKREAYTLGTAEGYRGYGPDCGNETLRMQIAHLLYQDRISPDEVFISDGAKCDIGRLQLLFGSHVRIAVQDPTYPVYVDTSTLLGQKRALYLPCHENNGFFPSLAPFPAADLIYLCFPNNPTGSVATYADLDRAVQLARKHKSLIIYDAAYAGYIQDPTYPRSIYEIEGANKVAIEVSSFSKLIGFTGVRLGWTIIPKELTYEDNRSLREDWIRILTTFFNGASIISQAGGLAALTEEGMNEMKTLISFYLENASLLRDALSSKGLSIYGGEHIPYLWIRSENERSWGLFQKVLRQTHLITTPGSGFGPSGEGFLRLSAFGRRKNILEACKRIKTRWPDIM